MSITPNMSLDLPTVSVTLGPEWATLLNAAMSLIDSHDHTSGKGVKITPSGLNLNANTTLNDFYLTDVGSLRLTSLGATLATPSDVGAIYNVNGDLWWNNNAGTAVQITSGGSVVAASDGTSRKFERASINSNTIISAASTVSYYDVDTTSGVTFTLPAANGVSAGRFYEFKDTTGSAGTNNIVINRAGADTIDGATSFTINLNYGAVRLVSDGTSKWATLRVIADTDNIRNSAVTTAKIADLAVTQAKRAALNIQTVTGRSITTTSTSFVDISGASVTITSTGRPIFIGITSDTTNASGNFSVGINPGASVGAVMTIVRDSTTISAFESQAIDSIDSTARDLTIPLSFWTIDTPAAGTYTYKVQVRVIYSSNTATVAGLTLTAYEL